jgi:hypothetical protein
MFEFKVCENKCVATVGPFKREAETQMSPWIKYECGCIEGPIVSSTCPLHKTRGVVDVDAIVGMRRAR